MSRNRYSLNMVMAVYVETEFKLWEAFKKIICTFLSKKYVTLRNILLCLVSLFFYVFDGSFHSLKILLAYGILNFIFGYILELSKSLNNGKIKLFTLTLFVTINVCGLVFYKYSYWLVSIISDTGLVGQLSIKKQTLP